MTDKLSDLKLSERLRFESREAKALDICIDSKMFDQWADEVAALEQEQEWMRREIERVGLALFTGANGYVGTEDDLKAIGQFVEGVCDTMEALEQRVERLGGAMQAFDIRGAESWARSVMEQWNHSDAETRKTIFGGMKIAEKLMVFLPDLKEALAALPEHLRGNRK